MVTKTLIEEIFYRIYDKNGKTSCNPKDDAELKVWLEKGKAPFLEWRDNTYYEITRREWRKIAKVEKIVRKLIEEVEPVEI